MARRIENLRQENPPPLTWQAVPDRPGPPARGSRRLFHLLLSAAHRACDDGLLELAAGLLRLGEQVVATEADLRQRRRGMLALIAAQERLWHLRHPYVDRILQGAMAAEGSCGTG